MNLRKTLLMKRQIILPLIIAVLFCDPSGEAMAKDMRKAHMTLEAQKLELRQKAAQSLQKAKDEAAKKRAAIRSDRTLLREAVARLTAENDQLRQSNETMDGEIRSLLEEEGALSAQLDETRAVNKELAGLVRAGAKDLEGLLIQSFQSALIPQRVDSSSEALPRHAFLSSMIDQESYPAMEEIEKMVSVLFDEIRASGEVKRTRGMIVDRQGVEREADLLILGNFTAIYALDGKSVATAAVEKSASSDVASPPFPDGVEIGFLLYSDQSQRFFALSKLPRRAIRENLRAYMRGEREDVYMDISKGAALRQLTHQLNLWEQIPKGGPIVWPIVAILALGLLILLERILFFLRKRINSDKFMKTLEPLVLQNRWDECRALLKNKRKKLIPKVLLTAIDFKDQSRIDMENVLQESILNEIPRIERFLSTLGMLAAIAPLLGLLGTVTGMINTFHTITYYGTGDPRMMSGGISEALVTTMLGLSVAIPIMLFHTLLSRRVETEIGKMEEKAVSFVNLVFRNRNGQCECPEPMASDEWIK